jgi:glycosyltransferase involved in cell wall biosynthesis
MPLVILEAMQNGCIPIVTKVGDLPLVIDKDNGILIENNEATVVQETFEKLSVIAQLNFDQINYLSLNSCNLIGQKYSMSQFASNYQKLLSI